MRAPSAALALGLALACRPAVPHATTTVEFWAMGSEGEAVRALVPAFEAAHPGLHIRVQQVPWSAAHEKLLTAFVGDSLPDALQVGTTWIPELVALGALAPLGARVAAAGLPRDDFFAGVLDASQVGDETWALPWYADTRLFFYRNDLFAEAGVRAPPTTWEGWQAALRAVRARVGPDRYALILPLSEWEALVVIALERGAPLLRDGGRYGDFESPAFRAAFDFYLSFFREGLAPVAGAAQLANLHQDFAAGFFASFISGPWQIGELRHRLPAAFEPRWATAALPGVSLAGGAGLAIARRSPHQDAAWAWLAWLAEPAQQVAFYRLTGDLPARRSAWRDPALRDDPKAAAFLTQLERVEPTPKVPEWEQIASRLAYHVESAVRGSEAPGEALAALDREADRVLEKRRWLLARTRPSGSSRRR